MLSYIFALITLIIVFTINTLGPVVTHIDLRFFDVVLHLLGGLGLGFFLAGLSTSFSQLGFRKRSYIIFGVFLLGIAWELFEIYYDIAGYHLWTNPYYIDTAKDLIMDTISGTIVAYLIIKKNVQQL